MNLKEIPKIELHLHLDGSVRLETASKLLNKSVDEIKNEMEAKDKCVDLNDYLTKFSLPISIMQTKDNLKLIAHELGEALVDDGVIYAEVRFAPLFHTNEGLTLDEVVESVLEGFKGLDIKVNLILCMMRNFNYEDNKKTIDLAYKYLNKGVCGIDLAGAEALYETSSFKDLFEYANSLNIPLTIHAGEADGISSVNASCDAKTKRIGHGIRSLEDMNTIERIKDNNILLEVCPTSNVQTNAVFEYKDHPIKKLYDMGVKVSINTDNRTVSKITLTEEYQKLMDTFDFTIEDFNNMNMWAIDSSFISNLEKEELKNKFKIKSR